MSDAKMFDMIVDFFADGHALAPCLLCQKRENDLVIDHEKEWDASIVQAEESYHPPQL